MYVCYADAEMHTLLRFCTGAAIESVIDQNSTPGLGAAAFAAAAVRGGSPIAPATTAQGSSSQFVRRHQRSNTYPDSQLGAAAELAAPYPMMGLHVEVPEAPLEPPTAAASATFASQKPFDGGTGLSTPTSAVSYPGGASSSSGLPQSVFLDVDSGEVQPAEGLQQGLWHSNLAFRASSDLDEQQQQQVLRPLLELRRSSSAEGTRSPFETAQTSSGLQLKDKQLMRSVSSGTGSPLIATSYDGGGGAAQAAEADAAAATATVPASASAAPQPDAGASGVSLQQQRSRPSSSSGGTLAERRALSIAPLSQASSSPGHVAAAGPRGNRLETWRSTLSPVPSASYDQHGLGTSGLVSSASAAPTFGRRSSAGVDAAGGGPGGYAPTPASRISGFGSQLFSLSGRRLHVPAVSASSSAAGSDEEGSSSSENEEEGQADGSPTKLQATRLQNRSLRHISGASMRQIARSVRRMGGESLGGRSCTKGTCVVSCSRASVCCCVHAGVFCGEAAAHLICPLACLPCGVFVFAGAPARLVHQQLSTHLLGALQHQLQQGHAAGSQDGARPGGSNLSKMATHMQALGLGAVTAEVQEGQPGAPRALL